MAKQRLSKPELLKKMGDHVLEHGLNTASLRPLAQAAETSDRMLIYHFGSKDALISQVLQNLATEYAQILETALPCKDPESLHALLQDIMLILRKDPCRAYIRIWLDLVSAAAQGHTTHQKTGDAVAGFFVTWLMARMPKDARDPEGTAMLMLTLIEGAHTLDSIGQSDIADRAISIAFPAPNGG